MLDEARWTKLVERLCGKAPPPDSFDRLVEAYSERQRFYHTLAHVEHCLKEFDSVRRYCGCPDEVEFALWLHDVVYDTGASDNEERSADVAREILAELGCSELKVECVQQLILITKHLKPPANPDEELIVDIDLSILGQPPDVFQQYQEQIRKEYSWVPEEVFRERRYRILESFLARSSIYRTVHFRNLYEHQARENLQKALAALTQK